MFRAVRTFLALLAVILLLASARPATAADTFVEGFADLPLMPGLEQIPDASLAFDATSGRIVVAFARGPIGADQIRAFYTETLGQLGWTGGTDDTFLREGERLTLDFTPDGADTLVRFSLLPR